MSENISPDKLKPNEPSKVKFKTAKNPNKKAFVINELGNMDFEN